MLKEQRDLFQLFHKLISKQRPESPGPFANLREVFAQQEKANFLHDRVSQLDRFLNFYIFSFIKYFDATRTDEHPDNVYMEREWRIAGNVDFELDNVYRVILPCAYATRFRQDMPEFTGQVTFAETLGP